ncbi:M42 family metallopeptidase [Caldinitratiruptor microaerophilus]|uniref:Aminopeptidase YsdC n=1 Tax=Caldinitratiruptor microaerophilus TaxID=671077 RepID=A0AA35CHB7_9FIRM|nr:M42 family metallopeptidase [Caldinitratiruptor microaerophilus]BDG58934.1 putative aminopeptidase YsdC [Caldinitratiruptor microaerophilus]
MDDLLTMYRELTEAPGVPGYEAPVREIMRKYLSPLGGIETDNLGSIVARKVGREGGPKILVAGHMDEVGFMVTTITEKGFLKFQPLGGWWEQVMLAQRVLVRTHKGDIVGVIGSKPPHVLSQEERKKVVDRKDMFIDVGASSREEAEGFGVRPGDPIVPICPFTVMPNPKLLMAKAWDNRAGCAVAIQVLRHLQGAEHPNVVYAGATVQEEVGLRGAQTLVNTVKPDVAFALDVGIAGDTPGMKEGEVQAKLGGGPVILLYDATMVPNVRLRDLVVETARAEGIPVQFDAMAGGGTDAGRFHLNESGVPSIVIGFATRYIHSHASIIHRDDMENAARLVAKVIQKLDAATVASLRDV